jgi:hypothetical protein
MVKVWSDLGNDEKAWLLRPWGPIGQRVLQNGRSAPIRNDFATCSVHEPRRAVFGAPKSGAVGEGGSSDVIRSRVRHRICR